MFVQPFSDGGPLYKPGVGGTTVLAEIDGKQLQTNRDFKLENRYLKEALSKCPELYAVKEPKWLLDDAETALEALLHLQELGILLSLSGQKAKKFNLAVKPGYHKHSFLCARKKTGLVLKALCR